MGAVIRFPPGCARAVAASRSLARALRYTLQDLTFRVEMLVCRLLGHYPRQREFNPASPNKEMALRASAAHWRGGGYARHPPGGYTRGAIS
jgi:hypothetical protein